MCLLFVRADGSELEPFLLVGALLLLGWRSRAEPDGGPGLFFAVGLAPDFFLMEPEPLALGVEVRTDFF